MFVGRQRELDVLQRRYDTRSFECVVIYGRRRVGKTSLINHFCRDKRAIYFQAIESSVSRNVESLSESIALCYKGIDANGPVPLYRNFSEAIEVVFSLAEHDRVIFVIDEYPYLARADSAVSSILQHAIDNHKSTSRLMMILCGSSMSFMASQVLGYESPLYGRRTAQIRLEPFDFAQSREFHPRFSVEESLSAYALTGGIPLYLEKLDDGLGMEENLAQNFLDPSCYLFEEPSNLLKQELRDPRQYNNVLQSIADGASRLNEIATRSHITTPSCSFLMENLQELGIVAKELPFGETSARKGIYRIVDSFFRFWYRYVPRYLQLINSGHVDEAANRIARSLPEFEGEVFERVCQQWIWANASTFEPLLILEMGRWWGTDPKTRIQEEIDIVAAGDPKGMGLLAECKWKGEPTGLAVLKKLQERSRLLRFDEVRLILFSRKGFTEPCKDAAQECGAMLVSFNEMEFGNEE